MCVIGTGDDDRCWSGVGGTSEIRPKKLLLLLYIEETYFEQALSGVRIATLEKTDCSAVPLNLLSRCCKMFSLVPPNLMAGFGGSVAMIELIRMR